MVNFFNMKIKLFILDNLIWFILIAVYCFFGLFHNVFFTWGNITFILYASVPIGFLVLAEGIVILSGNFDLSVGEVAGASAMLGGVLITGGFGIPPILFIFLPILIGLTFGVFNGILIGRYRLNPLLVTLGTLFIAYGLTLEFSTLTIYNLPEICTFLGGDRVVSISFFFIVVIFLFLVFRHSRFGRHYLAVGSDPISSNKLGVSQSRYYLYAFMISGLLSGIAGLMYMGYLGAVPPTVADNVIFLAFAGAVVSGISLRGGRGSIVNMVGGILLLSMFTSGLIMFEISPFMRDVFWGALVLIAVILNKSVQNIRDKWVMAK